MRIPRRVMAAIEGHARSAAPQEACGLLVGSGEGIEDRLPLRNASPTPENRYFVSPQELFQAFRTLREAGRQMVGIYHSHPRSEAYPSATDVQLAFYPDAVYIIAGGLPPGEIRGFRIASGCISEEPLDIIEG